MRTASKLTAMVSGIAMLAMTGGAALAQENTAPADMAAPEMSATASTDFEQSEIEAFAVAYLQVMDIGMAAEQQMQGAASEDDRMSVQTQAQQDMVMAVEGVDGISVEQYNALLTAAQADPALAEQVQGEVDALLEQGN